MNYSGPLLLIGSVGAVGVLHTIVPDHWVPITLIARQRGWTRKETVSAAIKAGTGHVLSTLAIALVVWFAGVAVAARFGHYVDLASSLALIAFGLWIAIASWLEMRPGGHGHIHSHSHTNSQGDIHGPESHQIMTEDALFEFSIYEGGIPPHFRLTGIPVDRVQVETLRPNGETQLFKFKDHGGYLQSLDPIPEPHEFMAKVRVTHAGHSHDYEVEFKEHEHGPEGHSHGHSAMPTFDESNQRGRYSTDFHNSFKVNQDKTRQRTSLLLILGSSPMVEGIPAFFAAGKYGLGLILIMSAVFALSTIVTYVSLCAYSTAGLQKLELGAFENYGEVVSGAFIALVGVVFWIWPVL